MNEKMYKTLTKCAGANIALGVITLVLSLTAGILMVICGGVLLKKRSDILL